MENKDIRKENSTLEGKQEENLLFGISILSILAMTIITLVFFPSASNAVSITVSGTLKTIKTKRPTTKVGQRIRPIESIVLFVIFVQFLFFPQQKP